MANERSDSNRITAEPWEIVSSLRVEIGHAMLALAENDLSGFEKSVAQQGCLCDDFAQASAMPASAEAKGRARRQIVELMQMMRVYSSLLQRSSRSIGLLLALCRIYSSEIGVPGEPCGTPSLSCEV